MIVRTCFYKILYDELGRQINKWAPWDPTRTAAQAYLYCERGGTTSGTLTENECWGGTHTLTGNVTVPDNIILTIADGATINLNGYYVQCQGSGQIIKQGSGTFSPCDVSIKSGSVIKGQYPNINSAIGNAVSGQTVLVASGTSTVNSSAALASGVTLQVNAGATVNFTGSYILQVNGVFTVPGTSGQHVIFDGQSHTRASMENAMIVVQSGGTANIQYADFRNAAYELTFWQNSGAITVQNCSFANFGYTTDSRAVAAYYSTGAVNISNSSFTGSGLNGMGVYATNTGTNVTISENTFTSCRVGIRCYSSNAFVTDNTIQNSGYYGIQSDNVTTAAEYRSNTITNSSYGIYLNSSSPWVMYNVMTETRVMVNAGTPNFADNEVGEHLRGYNTIANAGAPLLRAQNYATPYLGYSSEGGYNSLYDTDLPHMNVENHSGVYADNNYWGGGDAANYIDGTSWVLARNPLSSNPNPLANASFTPYAPCADQSAITLEDEEKLFQQALDAGYGGEYEQAKSILQTLIENNSGSKFPPLAILMYYEFNRMELRDGNSGRTNETIEEELINFLASLENRDKADSLRPFGLKLSAREAGFSRDFKRMNDYHTLIIQDYPNSVHELTSLYDQIAYFVEIERDLENAKVLLARMIDAYPKDKLTAFARILMGENVDLDGLEKENHAELAKEQLPTQFHLGPAVPNPFNPTTIILFALPAETYVRLAVYDVLGTEVAQLVNEKMAAGRHAVVFNGAGLASGLYFYRFEAEGFIAVRKMTLMK
ncbi:right-handed parallel beta-helix repeat-containing protein [candidate division KSB1 bacterium]|nr:right-handed parallel beta-helix repeat-containing protein [candidate division KSB1 bacterium]